MNLREFKRKCVMIGNSYEKTASGVTAEVTGARSAFAESCVITGASVQDGTPSPDSPVEIQNCGAAGTFTVRNSGKNLFDHIVADSQYKVTTTVTADGHITSVGNGDAIGSGYSQCKVWLNTGAYTISCKLVGNGTGNITPKVKLWYGANSTGGEVAVLNLSSSHSSVQVIIVQSQYYWLGLYGNLKPNETADFEIQIELGSTATEYEPSRAPDTYTAQLTAPLRQGDTWDLCTGEVVRKRAAYVFDGTEYISLPMATEQLANQSYTRWNCEIGTKQGSSPICTHIAGGNMTAPYSTYAYFNIDNNVIDAESTDTLAQRRNKVTSYLAAQYAAGTPVTVEYEFATPTTETVDPIPLALHPGTNIISIDGLPPTDITVKYY